MNGWQRPDARPEQVKTPDALLGWGFQMIHDQGRDGSDPVAEGFIRQLDVWVAAQADSLDFTTGLPVGDRDIWAYVAAVIDVQAQEHRGKIMRGEVEGQEALMSLASFAADEKQARIRGEADAERRHRQTMLAAWLAAGTSIAGLVVGVIALVQ